MQDFRIRRATREDVPAIVAMLADDALGRTREAAGLPLDPAYLAAFEAIAADPNQFLAVVVVGGGAGTGAGEGTGVSGGTGGEAGTGAVVDGGPGNEARTGPRRSRRAEAAAGSGTGAEDGAVAEGEGETVVGTLQLSFLPGLSWRGGWRGQIEGVRIAAAHRGSGLGRRAILWAIEECRARNCLFVQLTTDRSRTEAHRFYEGLGFTPSHLGYKLRL